MSYERELAAAQRDAARKQQTQAAAIQIEEEETAELESQEEEARAARMLLANQRTAGRGKGGGGAEKNIVGEITDTVGEITDLITAVVEIETIIVPLALLANYHVRFLSGNLGAIPEAGGPLSYVLDKCMELASAGAKTVGKTAGKSAAGAGGKSVGSFGGGDFGGGSSSRTQTPRTEAGPSQTSFGGSLFEVKKLAIWQIFLGIVVDVLLILSIMVNFLILFAVPLLILAAAGGLVFGFCTSFPDVCTYIGSALGVTI